MLFCKTCSLSPSFKEIFYKIYFQHPRFSFIFYLILNLLFLFLRSSPTYLGSPVHRFWGIIWKFMQTNSQKYHESVTNTDSQFTTCQDNYTTMSQSALNWTPNIHASNIHQDQWEDWAFKKVEFGCIVIVRLPFIWQTIRYIMPKPSILMWGFTRSKSYLHLNI